MVTAGRNWAMCRICDLSKPTRRERGIGVVMKDHNRWDGRKMIFCAGSGKKPAEGSGAPEIVFRSA